VCVSQDEFGIKIDYLVFNKKNLYFF
jgi:hypothetical protein